MIEGGGTLNAYECCSLDTPIWSTSESCILTERGRKDPEKGRAEVCVNRGLDISAPAADLFAC